ncbi:TIGR02391 family protein [Candidatus Nomurabacteria bacterium]|nr:TIGR02391 family protein [Candidatus Kaiserbacteria bacterium]MCB9814722.1 TIGR02391 family protein [Candidatus Nomurabacteria bacterium]
MPQENEPLKMSFDPNTIEHLGVRMYSTIPPVLAELIANSYDANAKEVHIQLNDTDSKEIIVSDNGHGMSKEDINGKFLRIGRNRRDGGDTAEEGSRKPIGKKGLGKLSFFGIADEIEVVTVRNNLKNVFLMKWDDIKNTEDGKNYEPTVIVDNESTEEENGTSIVLKNIRRTSDFVAQDLAVSLSKVFVVDKTFGIFVRRNEEDPVQVDNKMKYDGLNVEVEWNVPSDVSLESEYPNKGDVTGHLISTEKPISPQTNMRGITLFSRNKMVNLPEYFSDSTSSHFYSYLTGELHVDFIDELDEDVIGTDRQSLNWGQPEMTELRDYLRSLMNWLERDWRTKRETKRQEKLDKQLGIKTDEWFGTMPDDIRAQAETIVKAIVKDSELPEEIGSAAVKSFHALVPEYPKYYWRHLHDEVKDASSEYYQSGDYYHAFIEASKRYVNAVRAKAVRTTRDERALMQEVFPEASPILSVTEGYLKPDGNEFTADTLKNIRVAQQMFSEGVICGGRHPISHEEIVDLRESELFTEKDCLDALSLLSHLFWRLEHSTKMR